MKLQGLHILLTYQCNYECDHCFTWGSSNQSGTLTIDRLSEILNQAKSVPGCEWVYFEGGEPFLYYAVLKWGVEQAKQLGFKVGIVSNGYWATGEGDALEWLTPFKDSVDSLEISSDVYHGADTASDQCKWAVSAAEKLGIPVGVISIAQPDLALDSGVVGHLPEGESKVMYRGRAARKLTDPRSERPWLEFTKCPHEDLGEPERLHVDPFGNVHICQGISIGNLFERSLEEVCILDACIWCEDVERIQSVRIGGIHFLQGIEVPTLDVEILTPVDIGHRLVRTIVGNELSVVDAATVSQKDLGKEMVVERCELPGAVLSIVRRLDQHEKRDVALTLTCSKKQCQRNQDACYRPSHKHTSNSSTSALGVVNMTKSRMSLK